MLYFVLLTGVLLVYYCFDYIPSQKLVYEHVVLEYKNIMLLKSDLLDNLILAHIEEARTISSRSMMRNKIIAYKQGKMTFKELQNYSLPKYIDGLEVFNECIYAKRYIDGKILLNYSTKPEFPVNDTGMDNFPDTVTADVTYNDTAILIRIISPIVFNDTIVGYDVIFSSCTELFSSISDSAQYLHIGKENHLNIHLHKMQSVSATVDSLYIAKDSVFYCINSKFSEASYIFGKPKKEVFAEWYQFRRRQIITMALMILSFALLLFIVQQRNRLRFVKKSKLLQDLVNDKTDHLNKAVVSLEQTNKTLSVREKELKTINQTKDKFFSIIAHDLINPFSSMMGLVDILLLRFERFEPAKQKELITLVQKELLNTHKLLENLLSWSRVQRGVVHYSPGVTDFHHIVEETLLVLKTQVLNKNQQIENKVPKDFKIFADSNMITTVVRNLLSNAVKYSKIGDTIEIGADKKEPENGTGFSEVYVVDHGTGMDEETLANLFSVTKTISMQGTNKEPGTGLGLVLCKEFIDRHKGTITVKSKPGTGSTFIFTLPGKS